ncbi:hypothetical protein VRK_39450 [Vibrio sp. MEBiC08052]|nr:hypothetical protein VRK_39450 [Vibrio sp. MEBiC08052]
MFLTRTTGKPGRTHVIYDRAAPQGCTDFICDKINGYMKFSQLNNVRKKLWGL